MPENLIISLKEGFIPYRQ